MAHTYDDDFYDDGMDDPMSTYPTEYGTDDFAAGGDAYADPTSTAGAVNVKLASEEQKKKEAAAEQRRVQREAEMRRDDESAQDEARVWLAARGLSTEGLAVDALMALFHDMQANEKRLASEFDAIQAKHGDGVRLNRESNRINVARTNTFFIIDVAWTYPSGADSVKVESNDSNFRDELHHIVHQSTHRNTPGFLRMVVDMVVSLAEGKGGNFSGLWAEASGEELAPRAGSKKLEVVVAPPSEEELKRRKQAKDRREELLSAAQARASQAALRRGQRTWHDTPASALASFVSPAPVFVRSQWTMWSGIQPDQIDSADPIAIAARDAFLTKAAVSLNEEYTMLNCSGMPMVTLPQMISQLRNIQFLDLSNCRLRNLPSLGELRLQKLYLTKNNFAIVPETIYTGNRMRSLRILDLSHNDIDVLPQGLENLSELNVLSAEYNRIKRIECDVTKWTKLEVLEITDNSVREVPVAVARLERLWRLRVGANPLENLPAEIFYQGLQRVKEYLTELTPSNLPVAPRRLAHDVQAQCDVDSETAWCDVILAAPLAARSVRLPSYLVEARLPQLVTAEHVALVEEGEQAAAAAAGDDGRKARSVVTLPDEISTQAFDAFVGLLRCEPNRDALTQDAIVQVHVSSLVSAYGSDALNEQLTGVLRGRAPDADVILSDELEKLCNRTLGVAFDDGEGAASASARGTSIGDMVDLVVGPLQKRFTVHRGLLAARCPYFASMFRSGFEEADAPEVMLEEADPEVFAAFLTYVYADTASKLSPDNVVALLFLAVEYNVDRLRELAEATVGYNVEVDNVAQVIQLAYFLDSMRLKNACMYFVRNNLAAVRATEGYHQLQDELKAELANKLAQWGAQGTA